MAMQPMKIAGPSDGEETEAVDESDDDLTEKDLSFIAQIKSVVNNKLYIMLCACITGMFYILTGVQYWVSDYMLTELK